MSELRVVDADGHLVEPPDLWTKRLPASLRAQGPQLFVDPQRHVRIMLEGRIHPKVAGRGKGLPGFQRRWFGWDDKDRVFAQKLITPQGHLECMDRDGLDVAVCFPTLMLFAVDARDPELNAAICRAYNDWFVEEYRPVAPTRFFGVAFLSLLDPQEAAREARRAVKELGFRAIGFRPNLCRSTEEGPITLDSPFYEELWAEIERLDVPVMFHEGCAGGIPTVALDRYENYMMSHIISHPLEMMLCCLAFVAGGILAKHPKLRVAFCETGAGWAPYWLERIDHHYEKQRQANREKEQGRVVYTVPHAGVVPSQLFRERCLIMADPDETLLPSIVGYLGDSCIGFGSDHPHWDSVGPGLISVLKKNMQGLPEASQAKILGGNAVRFLGLAPR